MGKNSKQEDVDVVASHQALSVVAGWLKLDINAALEEGTSAEAEQPKRPQLLGLGAKYLPHHKAIGYHAALDDKLKKRLQAGQKRAAARFDEEQEAVGKQTTPYSTPVLPFHGKRPRHNQDTPLTNGSSKHGSTQHTSAGHKAGNNSDDDSDDEDRGKASMIQNRKLRTPQGGTSATDSMTSAGQQHTSHIVSNGARPNDLSSQPTVAHLMPGSRAQREALLLGTGNGSHSQSDKSKQGQKKRKKKAGQHGQVK